MMNISIYVCNVEGNTDVSGGPQRFRHHLIARSWYCQRFGLGTLALARCRCVDVVGFARCPSQDDVGTLHWPCSLEGEQSSFDLALALQYADFGQDLFRCLAFTWSILPLPRF